VRDELVPELNAVSQCGMIARDYRNPSKLKLQYTWIVPQAASLSLRYLNAHAQVELVLVMLMSVHSTSHMSQIGYDFGCRFEGVVSLHNYLGT
jgi:hypothetical protein